MREVKRMLTRAAKNLETFSHPRVSVALEDLDLKYIHVSNPSPDLGMDILGKRLEDIVHDQPEVQRLTAVKRTVLATGRPYHETVSLPLNGHKARTFDLSIEPTYDDADNINGLMSVNIDITDLVQARQQLTAANARLVKLLDQALDAESGRVTR